MSKVSRRKKSATLQDMIVIYVDLLGFRRRMAEAGSRKGHWAKLLKEYRGAMDEALYWIRQQELDVVYRGFTDNFIIAAPFADGLHPEARYSNILDLVAHFQLNLALQGWFVRGGVSVGPFQIDDLSVMGPPLIESYTLESATARDPRIVLSESAKNHLRSFMKFYGDFPSAPQNRMVLVDTDGYAFIDYLGCGFWREDGYVVGLETVERHKLQVESALERFSGEPAIWGKYRWIAQYHDFVVATYLHEHSDTLRIATDALRPSPSLLSSEDLPPSFKSPWWPRPWDRGEETRKTPS